MKKKYWNKTRKVLLLAVLLIFSIGIMLSGCSPEDKESTMPDKFFSNWMNYVNDEVLIKDLVIPGSHDAGSVGMKSLWETQGSDISTQLKYGSRYFDTRVKKDNGELKIYHGDTNSPGDAKMLFSDFLDDCVEFIAENSTELIILDFQHTWDDANKEILEMLTEKIDKSKLLSREDVPKLKDLTMKNVRDLKVNFCIIWRVDSDCNSEKPYLYSRNSELYSPYDGSVHRGKDEKLIEHFSTYYSEYKEDRLFVLQGQKTGMGTAPKRLEESFRAKMNSYTLKLKDSEHLDKTNIVMRDYFTDTIDNSISILSLNVYKNNIKQTMLKEYKKNLKLV